MKTPALLLLALLTACSGAEPPRAAVLSQPADSQADFGDLRVHYNALPTLSLSEAVAGQYGVDRDAGSAMLVVAVRRVAGGQELPAQAEVSAKVQDLQGAMQRVDFATVATGDYSDHIGAFDISPRDTYRFEITVKSGGRTEVVKFQRSF